MNKIFFAGAALAALAAVPAQAQPGAEARRGPAQPTTRAAVEAQVEARFARADSNRDGFVTQDEIQARAEARRGQRQERREQLFERLDANHDGSLSRAEFDARPALRNGERRGNRFARRGGRGGGFTMAGFGARAFEAMDSNRDGRVALAEAERVAIERFDRVDADRDGTISLEERQTARAARRERMQERQGD